MKKLLKHKIACLLPYCIRATIKRFLAWNRKRKSATIEEQLKELRNIIIFNNPITQVPPTTGKLRLLQEGNAVLLDIFSRKCDEHNLRYWIDYGTLLGAIRHKGFIPWDDDLDVGMLRNDYDKLIELLPQLFSSEEGFTTNVGTFIQIGYKGTPLNLDIFPHYLHSQVPSESNLSELKRRLYTANKKIVYTDGLCNVTTKQLDSLIKKEVYKNEEALSEQDSPLVFISPAAAMINIDILEFNDIFPQREVLFEGVMVKAPKNPRKCLECIYGDYMSYPPKVGFWHQHLENIVKKGQFVSQVNSFIDRYGR